MLSTMEDEYLKARSSDIEELSHRLLDILLREEHEKIIYKRPMKCRKQ